MNRDAPAALPTRVTELFGLRYPVVQGGMIWTAGWRLAAAVADAGGLGLIGAGSMTPELLQEQIRKTRHAVRDGANGVWGVNLPIFHEHSEAMVGLILDEQVKVVFTSGGSPRRFTQTLKEAGCRVAHVCSTPEQALKCQSAGVDAVVVEGVEAGGHDGPDELTTLTLVGQAVDCCTVPVLAAGGIHDGRTMAAALALGAEGVQVGSRLVASEEASCHVAFKQAVVEAGPTDTRILLHKLTPVRALMNPWAGRVAEAEARGATAEELLELLGRKRSRLGMFEGNLDEGELEIGQAAGAVDRILSAEMIVHEMVRQCRAIIGDLARRV